MKISFDSSPEFDALLDELKEQTGVNKKGLLVAGVIGLSWMVRQKVAGRDIASIVLNSDEPMQIYSSETLVQAELREKTRRPELRLEGRLPQKLKSGTTQKSPTPPDRIAPN